MNARTAVGALALFAASGTDCLSNRGISLDDAGFVSDGGTDGGTGCTTLSEERADSPQLVDFGPVAVHTVASQVVTVANCTNLDFVVTPGGIFGAQAALFTLDTTAPLTARAGTSITFTVSYAPITPSALDSASLQLAFSYGATAVVTLQGVAVQSGLTITPNPLNFIYVQPGSTRTVPLRLTNVGNTSISVISLEITDPGSPPVFALSPGSWSGGTLEPGATAVVTVAFSPTGPEQYGGELDFNTATLGGTDVVSVALAGWGLGPRISCAPNAVNFGTVAAGIGTTLPVICTNTGSDVPGHPEDGLIITSVVSNNPLFSAQVDPGAASPIPAGRSVQIDVSYAPTATSEDKATLTINSNATDGTSATPPTVELTGQSILDQRCYFSLTPTSINFGQVTPGTTVTASFTITDLGPNECLVIISDPTMCVPADGLPPIFPVSARLSPPGEDTYPSSLTLPVSFTETDAGSFSCNLFLTIDGTEYQLPVSGI